MLRDVGLISMVSTPNLGGGCIFPEESIGYFRSGARGSFVGESGVLEIL